MLALDSQRWASLGHAYGAAGDVPAMLRTLMADPAADADGWEPIWSALCHQGTVYTASYAAVPHIVELGAGLPLAQQIGCWVFVGCVARSTDAAPIPDDLREAYEAALVRCEPLIRATIVAGCDEASAVIYLLAAVAGVRGYGDVSNALEGLVGGVTFSCPGCDEDVSVEWDGRQLQATGGVLPSRRTERTLAVASPEPAPRRADPSLPTWDEARVTEYLLSLADRAGHPDVVAQLIAWEGVATCPACGHRFALRPTLTAA